MKIKTSLSCIITLAFLFASCKQMKQPVVLEVFRNVDSTFVTSGVKLLAQKEQPFVRIEVPEVKDDEVLFLSSIVDSVSVIQLSSEDTALIGGIDRIEFTSDAVYILDRYKTRSVKKFSKAGQYLSDVGRKGAGPGEYIEPTDFEIVGDKIKVYDQFSSRIQTYDSDGRFESSVSVPYLFNRFHFFSENSLLFYGVNPDNFHLPRILDYPIYASDSLFRVSHVGFYQKHNLYDSYLQEEDFVVKEGKVFYHPFYSDTIYSIDASYTCQVEYVFDFKNLNRVPEEYWYAGNNRKYMREDRGNKYVFFRTFQLMDDYVFWAYSKARMLHYSVYSKECNCIVGKGVSVKNDLNPLLSFGPIISARGNTLIGYCMPFRIIDTVGKTDGQKVDELLSDEQKDWFKTLHVDDNPIVVLFHLAYSKNKL